MHTKEELVQKKSKSQQLDLVETVSQEEKVAKKRLHLYLAIVATIGLSLFFWLFRVSQYYLSHPSDLIPKINLTVPQKIVIIEPVDLNSNLESKVSDILSKDEKHWSVSVSVGSTIFNWSKNKTDLSSSDVSAITDNFSNQKYSTSKLAKFLPEGIITKENFRADGPSFKIQTLIIVPKHQILLQINYLGSDTFPPDRLDDLVSSIYWALAPSIVDK